MRTLARWARAEWGPLYTAVRGTTRWTRRLRAAPVTVAAVCLTSFLQYAQNRPWGYRPVQELGAVRAAEPLGTALLRTPLSLFVPAPDLPVWGALAQVLVVFGIAEICLGRWRTLTLAYVATLAGTLYARVGTALGPHAPFGLPASDAQVVDTGPSAAVVGLAVFVGWRYGAYVTVGAVSAAMVAEVLVEENLAGKEHLAALAAAGAACLASAVRRGHGRRPRRGQRWPGTRTGRGSGLPPIQSWRARRGPAQRRSWR
ncbi:hypothetical protein QQY24_22475 [Streptomyces sp. TG1A-8]|uniref:hypothetical protein n=1 Tax=Streptomyces sp. TG1A-8 TaxID=3051385 RepID=UPI00265BC0BD|nr:hypothetical protein [Streptomyces sp. TG1A-8]MDO0928038.1 hypothetical protein [Streptomyces sp. TG1A-8]